MREKLKFCFFPFFLSKQIEVLDKQNQQTKNSQKVKISSARGNPKTEKSVVFDDDSQGNQSTYRP